MFSGLMLNTWVAATVVAVIAGVTGFFAVLRGSTFAAHAIPNGAFAGAAGATLLGLNPFVGLAVFSVAGALGIAGLSRRARPDVATALTFVMTLGVGALFVRRRRTRCCSARCSASAPARCSRSSSSARCPSRRSS
jgi:zinc/manganese transport system permease protein